MKIITPEIKEVTNVSTWSANVKLNVGDTVWTMSAKDGDTECHVDVYYNGTNELDNLKKILALADTTIDEHFHDATILKMIADKKEAQQKEYDEQNKIRLAREKNEYDGVVLEATNLFKGFTVKVPSVNNINVSDGTSDISIWRNNCTTSSRWEVDDRRYYGDSFPRRNYYGEKKTSANLYKLVEFVKCVLSRKTAEAKATKAVVDETEQNDIEMSASGWEKNGAMVYSAELQKSIKCSNSGSSYAKNGNEVLVKRIDGVLTVVQVTRKTNMSVEDFDKLENKEAF